MASKKSNQDETEDALIRAAIAGQEIADAAERALASLSTAGLTAPLPSLPATDAEVPPEAPGAVILARPDSLSRMDRAARMRIVREVCGYLEHDATPQCAAKLAGYSIDEIEALMIADPLARRMLLRSSAKAEFNAIQRARSGAKGVSKMALEFLARTHAGWATRTQQNLQVQFAEAVRELRHRLTPLPAISGVEALKIVLDVLEKHGPA